MATVDANALLLQVMAHDLLAPLTAVKWQIEIMQSDDKDAVRQAERLKSIYAATELGIVLTKHAHVAGRVLVGSYEEEPVTAALPTVVRDALFDLKGQYERHGLPLVVRVDEQYEVQHVIDVHLVQLFVWALAKYFLTCTPAHVTVEYVGVSTPSAHGKGRFFTFTGTATGVPEAGEYARLCTTREARDAYDQAFVFAKLLATVAPLIGATVEASAEGDRLTIEAIFEHPGLQANEEPRGYARVVSG